MGLSEKAIDNKKQYSIKYAKANYKRVPLDLRKEFYEYLKGRAEQEGKTVNGFIREAIDEKCENVKEDIPNEVLTNAMDWLKAHGHSADDICDFLQYLGKGTDQN